MTISGAVEVIVGDNSTDDVTKDAIAQSEFANVPWMDYRKNEKNIGYDHNILSLFCESHGQFVWLVGDDDIIFEGSLQKVIDLLEYDPDIVHLPFRQPQDLEQPQYQRTPRIKHWQSMPGAVEQILKYAKITSFVFKKSFEPDKVRIGAMFGHTGWMHLILGFEVLMHSKRINTITLSEFFAGSLDSEWKTINWTPAPYLQAKKLSQHEIFNKFDLKREIGVFRSSMYLAGIQTTLMVTSGRLSTKLPMSEYFEFGASYPFNLSLLAKPVWLLKFMIIKLRAGAGIPRLIGLYEKMNK